MNLESLLKTTSCRVSNGTAWLVWANDEWVVLERQPYARKNTTLYHGDDLQMACCVLAATEEV